MHNQETTKDAPVLFREHPTRSGHCLLEICLNAPRSLNALTLEMIDLIQAKLAKVRQDDRIVAVILDSSGDKAFCAGGDIVSLYRSMADDPDQRFAHDFFTREYRLDYHLHTFPKPVICWGGGIVMGGGMGLMQASHFRIVTETSHLAMPEVSIGLFPDVGASWFLNRLPGRTGLFLGLTGSPINAADALFLGMADRFIRNDLKDTLLEQLCGDSWETAAEAVITHHLREVEQLSREALPEASPIREHQDAIRSLTDQDCLADFTEQLATLETKDPWLQKAGKTIRRASPLAIALTHRQLHESPRRSLREVFQSELILALNCCQGGEFQEGVRALLIDKDNAPQWRYRTVREIPAEDMDRFFAPAWQGEHPLEDL